MPDQAANQRGNTVMHGMSADRAVRGLFTLLIAVAILFPVAWMAIAAFKGKTEVLRSPFQFFPDTWDPQNYVDMMGDPEFMRAMTVTFVGALIFTALSLLVNSMAAYALARLDFAFKRFWWVYCITPMFVPMMAILLTSFMVVTKLHMLNTMAVLIIPGVASSLQMFFLRQFYLSYPASIEEAALIDGANRWQIFWIIFVPQSKAPFVVVGTASFLAYWNAYVWPVLTITDPKLTQVMQVLGNFRSERGVEWGLLMAGSAIATLPTVILLLIFQRYIVSGVRLAGIK
jgi:multiple sugar transport system permease protein